jgi:RimJ/RimL family protein N-acetyltransferase
VYWRNQPELRSRVREYRALTAEHQERWYARITADDSKDFMFAFDAEEDLLGVVGLCYWHPVNRTAEISFYLGAQQHARKGYTYEALTRLIEWGWDSLDLRKVWAECYSHNEPGLGMLYKLNFQEEGRLRQHVYKDGQHRNSFMFGLLREEWKR